MTNGATYVGTITLGDEDLWAFTACTGDPINLRLSPTNFIGNLNLYGPNGALLETAASASVAGITYTATNCGTFSRARQQLCFGRHRHVRPHRQRAFTELRLCAPVISGARLTVNGVGGTSGTNFILYSTTNLAKSFGLWTPVLTNSFDQFGVLTYTNVYNPALPQQYFRFRVP